MTIVAIQADALASLNPKTDSSLMLATEALRRGFRVFFFTPAGVSFYPDTSLIVAKGHYVTLTDTGGIQAEHSQTLDLSAAHYLLIRQDPPFDMTYVTSTYILEMLHQKGVRLINDPIGIRNSPEKFLTAYLPDLLPPTLITSDKYAMTDFIHIHTDVVIKPLYEFGGRGVVRASPDTNLNDVLTDPLPVIVQQFIPDVLVNGDKRIILVDGAVIGAYKRLPKEGDIRSNSAAGGSIAPCTLSPRDTEICTKLAPLLRERGLYFVGIDIIGPYLTEVNATSPTGLMALDILYGIKGAAIFWDTLIPA